MSDRMEKAFDKLSDRVDDLVVESTGAATAAKALKQQIDSLRWALVCTVAVSVTVLAVVVSVWHFYV